MSGFEINLYSVSKEFHRYSTDDFALLQIGVGNFNTSSLAKFLNLNFHNGSFQATGRQLNPDIGEFFGENGVTLADKLIGKSAAKDMEILAFDEDDKVYRPKTGLTEIVRLNSIKYPATDFTQPPSTITDFLDGWNNVQLGAESDIKKVNGYKAVVNRIQSSLSGCILYDLTLNILKSSRTSPMRLYFLNTRDTESSKTISFNGSPFISALPKDATGFTYGRSNTDSSAAGVYAPPSKPANGPQDMVGAQMRLAYDPATKTWESGTQQVLARLVDDIDAVNIPELSGEEMLSISSDQTYGVPPEDNPWMGKCTKGRAIPLSTEDGNPNLYGPNFKGGCENTTESVVIMAVNRSSKSFKSGRLVVLSFINGEWLIVGGEGEEKDGSNIRFKNFEYQQYLIPAKWYFSVPKSTQRILPENVIQKLRYEWYLTTRHPLGDIALYSGITTSTSAKAEWNQTIRLNILASQIPFGQDPVQYLIDNFDVPDEIITQATQSSKTVAPDVLVSPSEYIKNVSLESIHEGHPLNEQDYPVPKNLQTRIRNVLDLEGSMPPIFSNNDELRPGIWEAPLFWGALFPNGHRSGGTKKFLSDPKYNLNSAEIYSKDPTLSELSIEATTCLPYFKDLEDLWRYCESRDLYSVPSQMRKTGVIAHTFSSSLATNQEARLGNVAFPDPNINPITGLEPLRPNKIQFTPMSIDYMYSASTIDNTEFLSGKDFTYLQRSLGDLAAYSMNLGGKTFTYLDYAKFLIGDLTIFVDNYYLGNSYSFPVGSPKKSKVLSHAYSFDGEGSPTLLRHAAPIATPNRDNVFMAFPKIGDRVRSPAMAVIAMKSTIGTSANGLRFTVDQRFGYKQRSTVIPGQGPQVSFIPLGAVGVSWNTPNTPVSVRQNPQWGNTIDRIDSFGSTALFVKVFEHWPEKDTVYAGGSFLPIHFSDYFGYLNVNDIMKHSTSDNHFIRHEYDPIKETWEPIKNDDGENSLIMSPLDFREPTIRNDDGTAGDVMDVGAPVTTGNLANFSNWKYNFIRRSKFLSEGGFAYIRRAIFVNSADLDPSGLQAKGGSGYKEGEKFVYPDGFTLEITGVKEVTLPGGQVLKDSINTLTPKSNLSNGLIINNNLYTSDITSASNIIPTYIGENGRGAMLKVNSLVVGRLVGHDPAPKQVVPQTRITSPSLRGADEIYSKLSTAVEFDETNKREFDIFYYFQNDPFVYALNALLHGNYDAQYVFSEVNPL